MKVLFIFCLLIFQFISLNVLAQDTIRFKNGQQILSKVLVIGKNEVIYKKWENLEGPEYIENKSGIDKILFQNGTIDLFQLKGEKLETKFRRFYLGAGGGLNMAYSPILVGKMDKANFSFLFVPIYTFGIKCFFSKYFFVQLDFSYNTLGYNLRQNIAEINGNNLGVKKATWKYDYLQIPVSIGLISKGKVFFEPQIGLGPSYLIKAIYEMEPYFRYELDESKKMTITAFGNVGIGYRFSQRMNARIYVGFQRNFSIGEFSALSSGLRLDFSF